MCGRYSILRSRREHEQFFNAIAQEGFNWVEQYNATPGRQLPVVLQENTICSIVPMQWGYTQVFSKGITTKLKINTRIETLVSNNTGNDVDTINRCIVPASGFYEWDKRSSERTPYYFCSEQQPFLCFAGVWQFVKQNDLGITKAFTIVTTEANNQVVPIHARMPLLLDCMGISNWLNASTPKDNLKQLQHPKLPLHCYPVSKAVNNPYCNNASCIKEEQPKQPCLL